MQERPQLRRFFMRLMLSVAVQTSAAVDWAVAGACRNGRKIEREQTRSRRGVTGEKEMTLPDGRLSSSWLVSRRGRRVHSKLGRREGKDFEDEKQWRNLREKGIWK